MKTKFETFLQKTVNHYLALDPESSSHLKKLQGKIVTIELLGIHLTWQLFFRDGKMEVKLYHFLKPDTTIRGTPLNLLHIKLFPNNRAHFFADDIVIEGNVELAQQVMELFDALEIDWEDIISRWIGDLPSYQIGRLVKGIKNVHQRLQHNFLQNVDEYVHEEVMLFPPKEALQDFFNEVDQLRMDLDRADSRIENIKKRMAS